MKVDGQLFKKHTPAEDRSIIIICDHITGHMALFYLPAYFPLTSTDEAVRSQSTVFAHGGKLRHYTD